MLKRTVTAIVLLIVGFPVLIFGGFPYFLFVGFLIVAAAWEYVDLFRAMKMKPARWLVVGGVAAVCATRFYFPEFAIPVFTFAILALMAFHLIDYERGRDCAALDFGVSWSANHVGAGRTWREVAAGDAPGEGERR